MTPDNLWTLKTRQSQTRDAIERLGSRSPVTDSPAFVGVVFANPKVPTSTQVFFSVHPVTVTGQEQESGPGLFTVNTSATVLVYVVGSYVPVSGDFLICRFVDCRWVAERMAVSAPNPTLTGCPCTQIPLTLTMTVSSTCDNPLFPSTTIVYGPTPSELASLGLGANSWLTPTTFSDPTTGYPFRYWFTCYLGAYVIGRVYANSVLGTPLLAIWSYYWLVGFPGNTCSPFLLSNGRFYSGGDASCIIVISE